MHIRVLVPIQVALTAPSPTLLALVMCRLPVASNHRSHAYKPTKRVATRPGGSFTACRAFTNLDCLFQAPSQPKTTVDAQNTGSTSELCQ
jgi:hypothetical protein